MDDKQRAQADVNSRIAPHVPRRAWESTVPIFIEDPPGGRHVGSGVLFQVADHHFVVTARHVAEIGDRRRAVLGIGALGRESLISVGSFLGSTGDAGSNDDPYDVAICLLQPDKLETLRWMRFLRIGDVSFRDPGPRAVFSLFGFPGVWSQHSRSVDDWLTVKPYEFTTYRHDGDTAALLTYRPKFHLLLAADPEFNTELDGSSLEFRDRLGQPVRFPKGLGGISGCSVWHIGDLGTPIEHWGHQPARVVGLQNGVYPAAAVIKASRWVVVTTLIHAAYPELRRSIELWEP